MLLVEQVRSVADEELLVNDSANYNSPSAVAHDWTTRVSKNITLSKQKLLFIQWDTYCYNSRGAGRVLVGSTPLASTGGVAISATATRKVWVLLSAGSYTLSFQSSASAGGTGFYVRVTNIKVGAFVFADSSKLTLDSGNQNVNNAQTVTMINQNTTAPQARKLPVGTVRSYLVTAVVYMSNTTDRVDYPRNVGEGNQASALSWRVNWDGTQETWVDRKEDAQEVADNISFGIGAYGLWVKEVDASAIRNLQVTVYNATGGARTCRCYIQILICPWVLTDSAVHQPVSFDFPQGSTFYTVLEPLGENPAKNSRIGKQRGISFGSSTDFYSTASGTDILQHSYTFETVQVANVCWLVDGLNSCISIVGVDVR